jgi:hypothetical protein
MMVNQSPNNATFFTHQAHIFNQKNEKGSQLNEKVIPAMSEGRGVRGIKSYVPPS